ncbi:MAG: metal-dependent hydrolase [Anaerolineae bacterium]|nr:metal-dependent hydrolase [Anaerolineae bacterium]
MSSPVGHGLAALNIYAATGSRQPRTWREWAWIGWLLVVAWMPDIDYAFRVFGILDADMRWTHSLVFCLFLPLVTAAALLVLRSQLKISKRLLFQLMGGGLSHLILDLLVGVWSMPLLWPFSLRMYRLPFGLLPSAGRPGLSNVYFYRNLLIEIGVLSPILGLVLLVRRKPGVLYWEIGVLFAAISIGFMYWAYRLPR